MTNFMFWLVLSEKNPAYGRNQLSQPMRIVGPLQILRGCVIIFFYFFPLFPFLLSPPSRRRYRRQGAFRPFFYILFVVHKYFLCKVEGQTPAASPPIAALLGQQSGPPNVHPVIGLQTHTKFVLGRNKTWLLNSHLQSCL